MTVNVDISPDILKWVLQHAQLQMLPDNIINYINLWIKGDKTPTFNQIEAVSKATGIPFGYFFLQNPPQEDLSFVEYRTVDSAELQSPSRNLIDTMHDMELIQDWMRDLLIGTGENPINFIGKYKEITTPELLAEKVRNILGIHIDWFKSARNADEEFDILRTIISNLGVIVMTNGIVANNTRRVLDINEFRAFAIVDEYAPLIFINRNDSTNARLFSLLHEFVHICLGTNSLFNDRNNKDNNSKGIEYLCNAVAAEILLPQSLFIDAWKQELAHSKKDDAINNIAKSFNCGVIVVARKAMDANYITHKKYYSIAAAAIKSYNDLKAKTKESNDGGGNYYATALTRIDKRFLRKLINNVMEGKTQYSEAFRLTNTNRHTFSTLIAKAGEV